MTRRDPAQAGIAQDDFLLGLRLQAWVDSALPEERGGRAEAMRRMIEAKQNRSAELSLDGLGLSSIPEQIGDLADLTRLTLNHNLLTTVHARIGDLAALKTLQISYNPQLNMIPAEISNLKALTHLYIFDSQLTTIPEGILSLPNLKRLDLRGSNQLTPSPAFIDRLSELETRGCVVKYPDQISIEVRDNRAKSRLQKSHLQQVSRTLALASYDPKSHLSQLEYGVMAEVLKFATDTRLLSEEEKKEVFEATEKGVKQTGMYKRYVKANSTADNQELETKSVTTSPAEVIASEEAEAEKYKSDSEELRSSAERSSFHQASHQASHQGDGGASAEEPRVGATASGTIMKRVCDSLSNPFGSSSRRVHPEPSVRNTTSAAQPLTNKGNKVAPSRD